MKTILIKQLGYTLNDSDGYNIHPFFDGRPESVRNCDHENNTN